MGRNDRLLKWPKNIEENMLKKAKSLLSGSVAKQASLPSFLDRSRSSGAEQLPAELPMEETSMGARLHEVLLQLKRRQAEFPPGLVNDLLESIPVLRTWQRVQHPTHAQRKAMMKHACAIWKLAQLTDNKRKSYSEMAAELGTLLLRKSTELLNCSVDKHTHWHLLHECTKWVEQQYREAGAQMEDEA